MDTNSCFSIAAGTPTFRWNSSGSTVAGSSTGVNGTGASQLKCPYALTIDTNYTLYITDSWNNRIQQYANGASIGTTAAGSALAIPGANATNINMPVGIVLDPIGNIYFTDRNNHRLMYWPKGSSSGTTIAGTTGIVNLPSLDIRFIFLIQVAQDRPTISSILLPISHAIT